MDKTIAVTHVNIRQSISVFIAKLLLIELFFSIAVPFFCFPMACINPLQPLQGILSVNSILFFILGILKLTLTLYVLFSWLNEYYEIKPEKITHRAGLFFRKEESYAITHVTSVELNQSLLGKFFNFGTIRLYDRLIQKELFLYMIHNPKRYFEVIKSVCGSIDEKQQKIREHIIDSGD